MTFNPPAEFSNFSDPAPGSINHILAINTTVVEFVVDKSADLCYKAFRDGTGMKHFEYKNYAQAPQNHRRVVAHACMDGMTPDLIASSLDMDVSYVKDILAHPPVAQQIDMLKNNVVSMQIKQYQGFHELAQKAIAKSIEMLEQPDVEIGEVTKLLGLVLKHHPDGMFAKKTVVSGGGDGAYRREMLERAKELGVVSAQTVLDAEYNMVSQDESVEGVA